MKRRIYILSVLLMVMLTLTSHAMLPKRAPQITEKPAVTASTQTQTGYQVFSDTMLEVDVYHFTTSPQLTIRIFSEGWDAVRPFPVQTGRPVQNAFFLETSIDIATSVSLSPCFCPALSADDMLLESFANLSPPILSPASSLSSVESTSSTCSERACFSPIQFSPDPKRSLGFKCANEADLKWAPIQSCHTMRLSELLRQDFMRDLRANFMDFEKYFPSLERALTQMRTFPVPNFDEIRAVRDIILEFARHEMSQGNPIPYLKSIHLLAALKDPEARKLQIFGLLYGRHPFARSHEQAQRLVRLYAEDGDLYAQKLERVGISYDEQERKFQAALANQDAYDFTYRDKEAWLSNLYTHYRFASREERSRVINKVDPKLAKAIISDTFFEDRGHAINLHIIGFRDGVFGFEKDEKAAREMNDFYAELGDLDCRRRQIYGLCSDDCELYKTNKKRARELNDLYVSAHTHMREMDWEAQARQLVGRLSGTFGYKKSPQKYAQILNSVMSKNPDLISLMEACLFQMAKLPT